LSNIENEIPKIITSLHIYLGSGAPPYMDDGRSSVAGGSDIGTGGGAATARTDDTGGVAPHSTVLILLKPIQLAIVESARQFDHVLRRDLQLSDQEVDDIKWLPPHEIEAKVLATTAT